MVHCVKLKMKHHSGFPSQKIQTYWCVFRRRIVTSDVRLRRTEAAIGFADASGFVSTAAARQTDQPWKLRLNDMLLCMRPFDMPRSSVYTRENENGTPPLLDLFFR